MAPLSSRAPALLGGLLLGLLVLPVAAQEASSTDQSSEAAAVLQAEAPEPTPEPALGRPALMAEDGTFDASPILDDPGLERWFSGVIRIERAGEVVFEYARGVDGAGAPLDDESIFWVASISKTFVSTAILQLVDEGVISLSDPASQHLPGLPPGALQKNGQACTVEWLLSHQCGLPRDLPVRARVPGLDPLRSDADRGAYLATVAGLELESIPGTRLTYSNVGFALAGLIVLQHATGTYDEELQRRLFAPLGLGSSGAEPARVPDFEDRLAPPTIALGPLAFSSSTFLGLPVDAPSRGGASGNAFSTAADLSTLFRALFTGQVLSDASRTAMTTERREESYGLGLVVWASDAYTEWAHNGALEPHGLNAYAGYVPDWDLTVVILSNRGMGVTACTSMAHEFFDYLTQRQPYRSPFPSFLGALTASFSAAVFVLLPLWFVLALLYGAARGARKSRLEWVAEILLKAWMVMFLRSGLRLFGHGDHAWQLPLACSLLMVGALWWGLRGTEALPRLPQPEPGTRNTGSWPGLVFSLAVIVGLSVYVGSIAETAFLMGAAAAVFLWGPPRGGGARAAQTPG
jgi:D-alanyl-D-alanine carboxypeptidase